MNTLQNRNVLSINETLKRAKLEGLPITETALRRWVKNGDIHSVHTGRKALLYWPAVAKFICGEQSAPTVKATH